MYTDSEAFSVSKESERMFGGRRGGCFCTTAVIVIVTLLVLAALVAVGLIVAYTVPRSDAGGRQQPRIGARDGAVQGKGKPEPGPRGKPEGKPEGEPEAEPEGKPEAEPEGGAEGKSNSAVAARLPTHIVPTNYEIELQPYLNDGTFRFVGKLRLSFTCAKPGSNITLHARDLTINETTLTLSIASGQQAVTPPALLSFDVDKEQEFLIIKLDGNLTEAADYELYVDFAGILKETPRGFYRTQYKNSSGHLRWVASSQMEAVDARQAFPCMDEPAMKAYFSIVIVRPKHMVSISNFKKEKTEARSEDWEADYYTNGDVKMPTYLVYVGVFDYVYVTLPKSDDPSEHTDIEIGAFVSAQNANDTGYLLNLTRQSLIFFEAYFDIKQPLIKLDSVSVPNFGANMENWGAIVYDPTTITVDPIKTPVSRLLSGSVVIAHEVSHQWFGNIVSMAWWDDLWLNEGFATYASVLALNHIKPQWKMLDNFMMFLDKVMVKDAFITSHPIVLSVSSPDAILEFFDDITYKKGAALIRMIHHIIGDLTFRKALHNYMTRYQYGNARTVDLWREFEKQAKEDGVDFDVAGVMDTWTAQMNYPLVTIERNYGANPTARISQKRFLLDPDSLDEEIDDNPYNYVWQIPYTYISRQTRGRVGVRTLHWLRNETGVVSETVPVDKDWLLADVAGYAYYRVNYDERNWNLLVEQLKSHHDVFSVLDRYKMIDDAFSLARAGELDTVLALQLSEYLVDETGLPWHSALRHLDYLRLMLKRTPTYTFFRDYVSTILLPTYKDVGWSSIDAEEMLRSQLAQVVTAKACKYNIQECIDQAQDIFDNRLMDRYSASYRETMYCTAISFDNGKRWEQLWSEYLATTANDLKTQILRGLACSRQPWLLNRLLDYATNGTLITFPDAVQVIKEIARSDVGERIAWDFFTDNWDWVWSTYGTGVFQLTRMIETLTSGYNTQADEEKLQNWIAQLTERDQLGTGKAAWTAALAMTRSNIKWLQQNRHDMDKWLRSRVR